MKKNKILKIIVAVMSMCAFWVYAFFYKAPVDFSLKNWFPISVFIFFLFAASFTVLLLFSSAKKALMVSLAIVSLLFIKHYRIIPIITYAIIMPLLLIPNKQEEVTEI